MAFAGSIRSERGLTRGQPCIARQGGNDGSERRPPMRALKVEAPWGLDAIEVVEVPDPVPGPGEVLVRMRAVSLNYRDLLMVGGIYGRGSGQASAITPFSDGCGVVEAVGPGVSRVKPGDRVSTLFFQNWISGPPTQE